MKILQLFLCGCIGPVILFSCTKNSGGPGNTGPLPGVKVNDITVNRADTAGISRFYVDLSVPYKGVVTVHYATVEGTAKPDSDFVPQSGTLTFQANQQELYIDVKVEGDSLRRAAQQFYLQLSDPVNCTLTAGRATCTINNDGTYLPTDTSGFDSPLSYPGYKLVWSDEFNGTALNTKDWNYENGGNGWGNNELENYTSRLQNSFLSCGNLVIEARQEDYNGNHYTSARITTQGKQEFTYGRIDIRAKLPVAKGMWPALWMLGSNIPTVPWPACGETDIMELIGTNPRQVVGSFHWKKSNGSEGTFNNAYSLSAEDFSQHFHVFSLIWAQDSLQILVDGMAYVKAARQNLSDGTYPFDNPFFLIFNVAVGGDWPGPPDNTTPFPQRMFVDYIRVFQKN